MNYGIDTISSRDDFWQAHQISLDDAHERMVFQVLDGLHGAERKVVKQQHFLSPACKQLISRV